MRWLGVLAALGTAVAIGGPPPAAAQESVPWPFYRETKQTTFNPYAPRGRYDGSAVRPKDCEMAGTTGRDVLIGTSGADVICGRGGDDVIRGHGGDDVIDAGRGDDSAGGGTGGDLLIGVAGKDALRGGAGADAASGGSRADRIAGGGGRDRIYGSTGADRLLGGPKPDQIVGEPGADRLAGGTGDDTLVSQDSSADVVDGGPGRNVAIADLAGVPTDRLMRIQSADPPALEERQECLNQALEVWLSCQGTGQLGNVTVNSEATFANEPDGQATALLDYIGLHGVADQATVHCCAGTATVGLGAGHWGSSDELWSYNDEYGGVGDASQLLLTSLEPTS